MQKTIKELEDIKRRVEDLLIDLKQSNQGKTMQDDKPSFVKNLWSRNPQKINGKYPSIK
jgi:aspartyl/asparaginyl beta-hydroxylase (cupin superfamily)